MQLWKSVLAEYVFNDTAGRETLYHACAALDRAEDCADQVRSDGPVIRNKGGGMREHPAIRPELAARSLCVRTLARLGLDYEPLKGRGRPGVGIGWTGGED
jgi:hypothetical protein